jgi:hypothetical protein
MKIGLTILLCIAFLQARSQQYVVDYQHLQAVSQNAVVRGSAEATHNQYLTKINDHIDALNENVGTVVVAQTLIYQGLSNVNSALKDGLALKNMAVIISDMTGYINQALILAKDEPYLLLFAGRIADQMRARSLALMSDVSAYILKEGDHVLADYNARDQLMRKVTQHLQILDGLAYGTWKSMYWARQRGLMATATPFASWVNQDKRFVSQIIQNAKYLKP